MPAVDVSECRGETGTECFETGWTVGTIEASARQDWLEPADMARLAALKPAAWRDRRAGHHLRQ